MRNDPLSELERIPPVAAEDSRDSTAKKGSLFPFILQEDGQPMSERDLVKMGLFRWKTAPTRRPAWAWTVHGGDNFKSLSSEQRRPIKEI